MMENEWRFLGNSLTDWLIATSVAIVLTLIVLKIKGTVLVRAKTIAEQTASRIDDLFIESFAKTHWILLSPLIVYIASIPLTLTDFMSTALLRITITTLLLQVAIWLNEFLVKWINATIRTKREEDAASAPMFVVTSFFLRVALWSTVLLAILDNLGIDITAMLAGLGIGGVAIALAAQNILGDVFSSLSIALDKPFVIGDFIVVGDYLGTVEYIGLKTTRLRSLHGEQIIFSNTDLLNSRIQNYKRMQERRVLFKLGVTYDTPHEKLARIPQLVKEIIAAEPATRIDRAHFQSYGDFSLIYEIVYYVLDSDYNVYMEIQHRINLAIYQVFTKEQIEFAFPTSTVHIRMPASTSR